MNHAITNFLKGSLLAAATFSIMPLASAADNPDDGLFAHYPFDGNLENNLIDDHHGYSDVKPLFTSDRFGKQQTAIVLKGDTHEYVISIADSNENKVLEYTEHFTVSAWVRALKDGIIIQQGGFCPENNQRQQGTSFRFNLFEGKLRMTVFPLGNINGEEGITVEGRRLVVDKDWHHLIGVFDHGKITLYVDGEKEAERSVDFDYMAESHNDISIGHIYTYCEGSVTGYADNTRYALSGEIDDLRLYNRALSLDDIQQLCCLPKAILKCDKPKYRQGEDQPWRVACDASESYDEDGSKKIIYQWRLDDEATVQSGDKYTFELNDLEGNYTLKVKITDDDNHEDVAEQQISITNAKPPVAQMSVEPSLGKEPPHTVQLNGSNSYHSEGLPIISHSWEASDGQTANGETATMIFNEPGEYTITLTVFVIIDDNSIYDTVEETVTVNAPPLAKFTWTEEPVPGSKSITVQLDASNSKDTDGQINQFEWQACDGQTTSGETASLTLNNPNNCALTLTVTDNHGASDTEEQTVTVDNQSPIAKFTHSVTQPKCGKESAKVVLNATASNDPDGQTINYLWAIDCPGDNNECTNGKTIISGAKPEIALSRSGEYQITLTVEDDEGKKSKSVNKTIRVNNCPPLADFSATNSDDSDPFKITLDASHSKDDDGTINSWNWNTCKGTKKEPKITVSLDGENSSCLITLTVKDNEGKENLIKKTITLPSSRFNTTVSQQSCSSKNSPPQLVLDARDYVENQNITAYDWEICPTIGSADQPTPDEYCSDGKNFSSVTPTPEPVDLDKSGKYSVKLTVTNQEGLKSVSEQSITVTNCPPIAAFSAPDVIKTQPWTAQLDATAAADYDGQIINYQWSSSVGEQASEKKPTFSFETCGDHSITLKVTDNEGAVSKPITKPIKVNCEPEAVDWTSQILDDPLTIQLDASSSYDEDNPIVKYEWLCTVIEAQTENCPDIPREEKPVVSFDVGGLYEIVLQVTDQLGAIGHSEPQRIELNEPPIAAFTSRIMFGNLPITVKLDASCSDDKDGDLTKYDWYVNNIPNQTTDQPQAAIELSNGQHTVTLTVTDNQGATNTIHKTITIENYYQREYPYNNTARPGPQIIAAGVTPSKVDLKNSQFDIVALVRPGSQPIHAVSFQNSKGAIVSKKMTLAGILPNGDEIYKVPFVYPIGRSPWTFETAWGPGDGQYNITVVDKAQEEQKHIYPYLRVGNFPQMPIETKPESAITYNKTAVEEPQVIMAGYTPALLDFNDDEFDVIAIIRAGKWSIKQVVLKQNTEGLFHQEMPFIGELENGDRVYKVTYTYPRGSLGIEPYDYRDLWGPNATQFGIEVTDERGQRSHKFPNIEFGDYPEWDGNSSTGCESVR